MARPKSAAVVVVVGAAVVAVTKFRAMARVMQSSLTTVQRAMPLLLQPRRLLKPLRKMRLRSVSAARRLMP